MSYTYWILIPLTSYHLIPNTTFIFCCHHSILCKCCRFIWSDSYSYKYFLAYSGMILWSNRSPPCMKWFLWLQIYHAAKKEKKKRICHVVVINSSISVPSSFYISSFITRKKLVSLDKLLDIGTINGILEYKCPLVLLTWGKNREPKVMIGS